MGKEKSPRRVADNEALAVGTQIRGSAQKLNLVAALIRGRKVEDAMNVLAFSKRAMAVDVRKVLASAIANETLTVWLELPATGDCGRSESPYRKEIFSSGRPSRSAACWIWTVAVPMPISFAAIRIVAEPSAAMRARAVAGDREYG